MAYLDPAAESVGTRVRRARKRAGIPLTELARRVGRAQSWVSAIENDSLPLDSIALVNTLARALRVHPNELTAAPTGATTQQRIEDTQRSPRSAVS
ncbi:helix-turn-helix domain-containing protein [Streptosporangium sp. NPDC000095]|uniref:helix-turn-helix domain-containing protein n=1 Tax=Streptosporangium sp. NPDC000095 TaxID=3366184 RepID=UPI0036B46774